MLVGEGATGIILWGERGVTAPHHPISVAGLTSQTGLVLAEPNCCLPWKVR